jgi:hypothetical protein
MVRKGLAALGCGEKTVNGWLAIPNGFSAEVWRFRASTGGPSKCSMGWSTIWRGLDAPGDLDHRYRAAGAGT